MLFIRQYLTKTILKSLLYLAESIAIGEGTGLCSLLCVVLKSITPQYGWLYNNFLLSQYSFALITTWFIGVFDCSVKIF